MDEHIAAIKQTLALLKTIDRNQMDSEQKAKVDLGLAFAVNSLTYSAIRAQGKVRALEEHEALAKQTNDIKGRFYKLQQIVKKRDQKAKRDEEHQLQIEANDRMIKNHLRVRPDRNLMSSDSDEQAPILKKRKRDEVQMHGATVVPEPAFLKHRKMLNKKF